MLLKITLFTKKIYKKIRNKFSKTTQDFEPDMQLLFDSAWYLTNNLDVAKSNVDPFTHFCQSGWKEGRDPHAFFSVKSYLEVNPDVAEAKINPLLHYVRSGAGELRDPGPKFDAKFYINRHPEASPNPLLYHLQHGMAQGWKTLPTRTLFQTATIKYSDIDITHVYVDIIIPVYRGLEETKSCLESVLADENRPPGRIIVIDDCSPEPAISAFLEDLASQARITLISNTENLGFVASVNSGMAAAGNNDVVLLNSDTEVPHGWLTRLATHAYADPLVATVTPFSNNATICSYPSISGSPLPPGYCLKSLDDACKKANPMFSIKIPTAVGFCMYIKRRCLDEIGLFDQEAFGRGYGEENDFCMRASLAGWQHILACDTFVYHAGELSFGKNSEERKKAWNILIEKYPAYPQTIAQHVEKKPTKLAIFAVTSSLFQKSALPTILMITHNLGGGTERHIQDLINQLAGLANVLILKSRGINLELSVATIPGHPIEIFSKNDLDDLITCLLTLRIKRVHIHHWIDFGPSLRNLINRLGVPFDVTIHDYFSVCPRINLLPSTNTTYCDNLNITRCNLCIMRQPTNEAIDIFVWHASHFWVLNEASRVICPSQDTYIRLNKFIPLKNSMVVYHEPISSSQWYIKKTTLMDKEPLRIAVLGALASHKGLNAFTTCVTATHPHEFQFIIIGYPQDNLPKLIEKKVIITGRYADNELLNLINTIKPHVLWFPNIWPETYSYTLDTAIDSGLPIIAKSIGAFPERLSGRPNTWLANDSSNVTDWIYLFHQVINVLKSNELADAKTRKITSAFYPDSYLSPVNQPINFLGTANLRSAKTLSILLIPDRLSNNNISPCGYIRLLVPIYYIAQQYNNLTIHYCDIETIFYRQADILICQRHVTQDVATAEKLLRYCEQNNIKIIYDIDDDLINNAPEHNENDHLQSLSPIVIRFLIAANAVWVSTQELLNRINILREDNITVIPNYLDERIWAKTNNIKAIDDDTSVRILYMGTATHTSDYFFLEKVADLLSEKLPGKFIFELIGITDHGDLHPAFRRINPPLSATVSYPAFVTWLVNQNRWDIGVAPLIASGFSRTKSNIKLLDYAAMRLPVVASKVPAYQDSPELKGAILVENDPIHWSLTLAGLIQDAPLRENLARECFKSFHSHYSLAVGHKHWYEAICNLVKSSSHYALENQTADLGHEFYE